MAPRTAPTSQEPAPSSGLIRTGVATYHPEKTPSALDEKIRLGASNAAEAIQQAVALVGRDSTANVLPLQSEVAGSAAESKIADYIPGLKGAAGYLRRRGMTDTQNQFQNLLNVVAHNSVGLLPGSRQSIVLFQNLRDSYATQAGDPPGLRAQKLAKLQELGQRLARLARGEDVTLSDLPGFEDFQPLGTAPAGTPATPASRATPTQPLPGGASLDALEAKYRIKKP